MAGSGSLRGTFWLALGALFCVGLEAGCRQARIPATATAPDAPGHGGAMDRPAATSPPAARLAIHVGDHTHPISTRDPQAQKWFDQGLKHAWAFNHEEARIAFEECARLDPDCAMCWWGLAYVLGPNYNLPGDPERDRRAWAAVERARGAVAKRGTEAEREYVAAIAGRYVAQAPADRRALDQSWADAMREVARRHPDDLDAEVLAAEALMDLQPWDLWQPDGSPKGNAAEIVARLEGVLARDPGHPGANHLYIHAVEASSAPERATGAADRLRAQDLEAGHLVHMPSHIYVRTGRWAEASEANSRAIAVDEAYIERWRPDGPYPEMYYPHNVHFLSFSAGMEGRSREALAQARKVTAGLTPEMIEHMPMLEGIAAAPRFQQVRFARWEEILAEPAPPAAQEYLLGIHHWSRGLAFAATGRTAEARGEARALDSILAAMPPDRLVTQVNTGQRLLGIASKYLGGEIAAARGRTDEAVRLLEAAVELEDGATYMEPPDWFDPVRRSLGAVLLRADRPADAELVYREDLRRFPENGWSLTGLAASLERQGRGAEAAAVRERAARAFARADAPVGDRPATAGSSSR